MGVAVWRPCEDRQRTGSRVARADSNELGTNVSSGGWHDAVADQVRDRGTGVDLWHTPVRSKPGDPLFFSGSSAVGRFRRGPVAWLRLFGARVRPGWMGRG